MRTNFSAAFWEAMKNLFAKIPVPKFFHKITNPTLHDTVVTGWKLLIQGLIIAGAFLLFGAAALAMEHLSSAP